MSSTVSISVLTPYKVACWLAFFRAGNRVNKKLLESTDSTNRFSPLTLLHTTPAPNTWSYMIKKMQCKNYYRELHILISSVKSNAKGSVLDRNMRISDCTIATFIQRRFTPPAHACLLLFLHVNKCTPAIAQTSAVGMSTRK